MNLHAILNLINRADALERRVRTLEAYMQAEANFRLRAWHVLAEAEQPAPERCERALQILAAYDIAAPAVVVDGMAVTTEYPPIEIGPVLIDGAGIENVIYCRSDSIV